METVGLKKSVHIYSWKHERVVFCFYSFTVWLFLCQHFALGLDFKKYIKESLVFQGWVFEEKLFDSDAEEATKNGFCLQLD